MEGHYVTPSINLVGKFDPNSIYQKSEIFGPNVAIHKSSDFEETTRIINSTGYGLVAALFTKNKALYEKSLLEWKVGLLNWNRTTNGASSKLPFGGMLKSGNDRPSAHMAIQYCSVPIASLEDPTPFDASKVLPGQLPNGDLSVKKVVLLSTCLVFFLTLALGYQLWTGFLNSPASDKKEEVIFEVAPGQTLRTVAQDLEKRGVIKRAMAFLIMAKLNGQSNGLKVGEYLLDKNMKPNDVLQPLPAVTRSVAISLWLKGSTSMKSLKFLRSAVSEAKKNFGS